MYNHETKLWHRLVAFLLSFVMVLGMLPANVVFAEELPEQEITETVALGTVEAVPAVGTVDGSTVTFSGVTLETVDAESGWQIGAKVTAPEDAALERAVISGEYTTEGNAVLLTAVLTKDAAISGEQLTSSWDIDWNGDTVVDQTVVVTADPAALVLTENGTEVFPAPYGVGTVTGMLENAEGILETFTAENGVANFSGKTLDWKPIDNEKDRTQEGWWIGVRVDAPAGMDQAALELAQCGPKNGAKNSFWSQMDIEGGNYLTFWCLVTEKYLEDYNPLSYTWVFDWNGDGHFEQTVQAVVDPANITLVKNGEKVYPTVTVTAEVTGAGTVMIDGVEIGEGLEIVEGKEVTVTVTPGENERITSLTIGDQEITGQDYNTAGYEGKFAFSKDTVIKVSFITEYTVTFETNAGVFTDENGSELTSLTVLPDGSVSFKLANIKDGYTVVVKDNGTEITAVDGVYTISNINENHNITAVVNDTTAPAISNVDVSDADAWMQKKTITFTVSDNEGDENVTTYVSATHYENVNDLRNNEQAVTSYKVTDHIGANTTKTYYIYAVDKAGNMAVEPVKVQMVDTKAPVIENLQKVVDRDWRKDTFTFTVKEPDSGIAKVTITHTNMAGQVIVEELQLGDNGKYTFDASEITEYVITVVDNAGNSSRSNQFADGIDLANPTVTLPEDICTNSKKDIEINIQYNDTQDKGSASGVQLLSYYYVDENGQQSNTTEVNVDKNNTNFTLKIKDKEDYNRTYFVWVTDGDNKESEVASIHVIKDTTNPVNVRGYYTNEDSATYFNGWYDIITAYNTVEFEIAADDEVAGVASGISHYQYRIHNTKSVVGDWIDLGVNEDGTPVTAGTFDRKDGLYKIEIRAYDKAGNHADSWLYKDEGSDIAWVDLYDEATLILNVEAKIGDTTYTHNYPGTWTKEDIVFTLNGNVDANVTALIDHYEYQVDGGDWTAMEGNVLAITENTCATYRFRAVSTTAGNYATSEEYVVKIRNTPPEEAQLTINGGHNGTNEWYCTDVTIEIKAPASGYSDLTFDTFYTIYQIVKAEDGSDVEKVYLENIKIDRSSATIKDFPDGRYYIKVWTEDSLGHKTNTFLHVTGTDAETGNPTGNSIGSLYFNIDTTVPDVEQMTIICKYPETKTQKKMQEKRDEDGNVVLDEEGNPVMETVLDKDGNPVMETVFVTDDNGEIVYATDDVKASGDKTFFDKWYNSSIKIELSANLDVSGEGSLQYLIVPNYGAYNSSADNNWLSYNSETGVVIDPNEKFVLIFRAEDAAGNVSEVHSTGIVVDDEAPSADETKNPDVADTAVIFTIPEADGENDFYVNENGYEIQINLFDPTIKEDLLGGDENNASGLNSITYTLETVEKPALIREGKITIEREDEDENAKPSLIFSQSGSIFVDAKYFDGYTVVLKVVATDNAGNSKTFTSDPMKIDITKPVISVDYTPTNSANNTEYFDTTRTATVTVIERNFDREHTIITIGASLDGQPIQIPAWLFVNIGGDTWQATVSFDTDGNYTFDVSATDLAGHSNEGVTYTGEHPNAFVIDLIDPVINVSYDLNNPTNGNYFNAVRTATVVITERNFDVNGGGVITIGASLDGQAIQIPAWQFAPAGLNTYTATVRFENDGDYTFDVSATDRAGRTNGNIVNYGNSAVPTAFTIDKTIVQPEVGGVEDGGSYSDEAKPSVDIYDVNYDGYTLTLERINQSGKETVTEEFFDLIEFVAPGGTLRTEDIPHIKENDGIYILTVTITDKAGNTSEPRVTTFTVNRFGSIYLPEDSLQKVTDGYNYQIEQDLVMTEINPNLLKDGSVKVQITRDGKPVDAAGVVITPKNPTAEHGWYEYTYTLNKDLFTEDGVYKITFLSEDSEGHENQSETITFRVDTTAPELSSVVGLEEPIVNAQEHEVRFTVFDAIGLESISIYIDDMEVPAQVISNFDDPNNFTGSFKLFESNDAQSVRIVIRDLAGNELDTGAEDFTSAYEFNDRITVSTNWFVRWFANKPLFFGSLAGIGGAGWLLWFLIFGKRKKEEEEEQAV